jgi:hypothetical protein
MKKEKNTYNTTKVIFWSPKLIMRYYGRKQQNVIDHVLRTQRWFLMDEEKRNIHKLIRGIFLLSKT